MKKLLMLIIVSFLLFSCGKKEVSVQEQKKQARKVPVMVEMVKIRSLNRYIPISGRVEGAVDMVLSSETNGKVTHLYKMLGERVEKGEELGKIDNREYEIQLEQAEASVLGAEANYKLAEMTLNTNEKLHKQDRISQLELIQAESSFMNAKAALQTAKANLERAQKAYDNSILIIPVSGYIADIPIQIGEYISPGKPIASIIETEQLKIKTGIGERHISKLKKGQLVSVKSPLIEEELTAEITGLGRKIMPGTATYPLEMLLENPKQTLLPGMLVHTKILSDTYEGIIYTNLNNIIKQYDEYFVYVIDENNQSRKRKVILGEEIADNVIIESGLEENEKLVVEGIANLEEGSFVEIRQPSN